MERNQATKLHTRLCLPAWGSLTNPELETWAEAFREGGSQAARGEHAPTQACIWYWPEEETELQGMQPAPPPKPSQRRFKSFSKKNQVT